MANLILGILEFCRCWPSVFWTWLFWERCILALGFWMENFGLGVYSSHQEIRVSKGTLGKLIERKDSEMVSFFSRRNTSKG